MNLLRPFFCWVVLAGGLALSAHGQLVHLAFTEGDYNGMIFRANDALIPWNHTGGYISRFDVWYDANDPSDPSRNLWRAKVFAYGLGNFEIIRSHDGPSFYGDHLLFLRNEVGPYEALDLLVEVVDNVTPEPGLPVPPFSIGAISLYFAGGRSYFDVPDLAEGYGYGLFGRATASVVQSVDLYPVPEPSTYGMGAIALLGAAVIWNHRRTATLGGPGRTRSEKPTHS